MVTYAYKYCIVDAVFRGKMKVSLSTCVTERPGKTCSLSLFGRCVMLLMGTDGIFFLFL